MIKLQQQVDHLLSVMRETMRSGRNGKARYGAGAQTVRCAAAPGPFAESIACSPGRGRALGWLGCEPFLDAGRRMRDHRRRAVAASEVLAAVASDRAVWGRAAAPGG